ncbi:MAG TPA: hypothetical protein VK249_26940 [Anaerolineales bacterium]|nr:hypothetical protein [Anaerolineales bacterium]
MIEINAPAKGANPFGSGRTFLFKCFSLGMIILSLIFAATGYVASAQQADHPWYEVRSIYTADYALGNPQGMIFSPVANALLAWDENGSVTGISLKERAVQAAGLKIPVADAPNVAFNEYTESLFVLRDQNALMEEFRVNKNGVPIASVEPIRSYDLQAIDIQTAHGMVFDPNNGRLFILTQEGNQLVSIMPGTGSGFDGNAATREGRVKRLNLRELGYSALYGITLNPNNGNLYLSDPLHQRIYEITQAGKKVSSYDLSRLQLVNPRSMVFAPSVDATDDPTRMNLFILDSSTEAVTPETATLETQTIPTDGRIIELALSALPAAPANQLPTTLVHTINTSNTAWSPSSPDTSGVVYWPAHDSLLMSDSEVEEMPPYWVGKNVFESTLTGSLVGTCATYPGFSSEPTGVAVNPINNHIFFSDDDADRISEVNPGLDNVYCTADDTVTYVNILQTYNIGDPEDVAYAQNTIFIAGGTDAEVYMFGLGVNGVIGGGDDGPLTHFDTSALGFQDLEGVGYNPDRGTLFIVSTQSSDSYLGELTVDGTLLYAYNLSYLGGNPRSSVTYAPSSQNSSLKNIYIASRGVDNGANPNENDGKVWEISLGGSQVTVTPNLTQSPTSTQTRTSTPTITPTFTPPIGASTNPLYISLANNGTVSGLAFADEDILRFDGQSWSLFFDGSDVGLGSTDTFGFSVVNANTILFSFSSAVSLGGLAVTPRDIVRFEATSLGNVTAGTFSMYLNGIDVGLDTSSENIDSISLLPDGRVLISTTGNLSVPGVTAADEDILAFTPVTLGEVTSGTWAIYFDGSDVDLSTTSDEDIDALDVAAGNIYLSTLGNFSVNGVLGADEDIFICSPTSLGSVTACNYAPVLYFDGSAWGLDINDVDAFNFLPSGVSTSTPTATATPSPTETMSRTPTNTSTPSATPTTTATFTPTITGTISSSPTGTYTATPSATPTSTATSAQSNRPLYLSLDTGGAAGGVAVEDVDILYFDGTSWSLFFDASDVGISTSGQDLNDFQIVDSSTILMSFETATTLGTLAVDPWDIVRFNATSLGNVTSGTFSMYLDGSDVGLDTTSEAIDALDVLPDGRVLISTVSSSSVPGISALDEDLLAFTPTSLGDNTSGTWAMYFDGSDVGLADSSSEDISGLDVTTNGDIYLSTLGDFSVPGISGTNEDVFVCIPISIGDITACNYLPSLYFDGSIWALDSNHVDGIYVP